MSGLKQGGVFKIVVLGDDGVGKTSLIRRYVDRHFREEYLMTIGVDFSLKKIEIGDTIYTLQIWDMIGQERLKFITKSFFRGASAAVVMFDLTNENTFDLRLINWLNEMHDSIGRIPIILAGNKVDLKDNRKVAKIDGSSFANKLSCPFVETSAKTGENVDETFQQLLLLILKSKGIEYDFEKIFKSQIPSFKLESNKTELSVNKWGVKPEQAEVIENLERLIKQEIPKVTNFTSEPFGVVVEGDDVIGIGLARCGLPTIPDILIRLNSLKELRFYESTLTHIPEFVFDFKSLKMLGLQKNQLEEISPLIGKLKSLEHLSLRENKISDLPDSLSKLVSLDYLNLSKNQFTSLPEVVCQIKSLKKLNLSENRLEKLPVSFGQLNSLEELDCSNNNLESLPENFGNLQFLITLNLYFNKIRDIPKSFQKLKSLEVLNLSYNQLAYFPDSFLNLEQLEFLGIQSNRLTELPMKLWHLKNLDDIQLDGNPWEGEWKEVVKNTVPEIFNYCRKHDAITVFCSHAEVDYHNNLINIPKISQYLYDQEEIYKVYYSEEAILGGMNFEEFMRKYVPLSHVLLFFATENSLHSKPCKFELQLALDNQIPIIPILGPKLKWENLNQISLMKSGGETLQLGGIKGVQYLSDISTFGKKLYNHIYELKQKINLFDKEEMIIDQLIMEFAEYFNDFIKSNEFHSIIKSNYNEMKEVITKFKNQSISFSNLVENIFKK
jgi:small GTP-binding protein